MKIERYSLDLLNSLSPSGSGMFLQVSFAQVLTDEDFHIGDIMIGLDGHAVFNLACSQQFNLAADDLWRIMESITEATQAYQNMLVERSNEDIKVGRLIDHAQVEKELG